MGLYTKNGRPLQVSGNVVYSRSGKVIGRISGEKVYGTNGRYVGTITGDRLVYRSTDSASMGSSPRQLTAQDRQQPAVPGLPFGAMSLIFRTEADFLVYFSASTGYPNG